jgi:hypothetical protein
LRAIRNNSRIAGVIRPVDGDGNATSGKHLSDQCVWNNEHDEDEEQLWRVLGIRDPNMNIKCTRSGQFGE